MAFRQDDLGGLIVLRKLRGEATDTGEEATLRVLAAGRQVIGHEIGFCARFDVGHRHVPTVAGGVFHAWYVSRLLHGEAEVISRDRGLGLACPLSRAAPGPAARGLWISD